MTGRRTEYGFSPSDPTGLVALPKEVLKTQQDIKALTEGNQAYFNTWGSVFDNQLKRGEVEKWGQFEGLSNGALIQVADAKLRKTQPFLLPHVRERYLVEEAQKIKDQVKLLPSLRASLANQEMAVQEQVRGGALRGFGDVGIENYAPGKPWRLSAAQAMERFLREGDEQRITKYGQTHLDLSGMDEDEAAYYLAKNVSPEDKDELLDLMQWRTVNPTQAFGSPERGLGGRMVDIGLGAVETLGRTAQGVPAKLLKETLDAGELRQLQAQDVAPPEYTSPEQEAIPFQGELEAMLGIEGDSPSVIQGVTPGEGVKALAKASVMGGPGGFLAPSLGGAEPLPFGKELRDMLGVEGSGYELDKQLARIRVHIGQEAFRLASEKLGQDAHPKEIQTLADEYAENAVKNQPALIQQAITNPAISRLVAELAGDAGGMATDVVLGKAFQAAKTATTKKAVPKMRSIIDEIRYKNLPDGGNVHRTGGQDAADILDDYLNRSYAEADIMAKDPEVAQTLREGGKYARVRGISAAEEVDKLGKAYKEKLLKGQHAQGGFISDVSKEDSRLMNILGQRFDDWKATGQTSKIRAVMKGLKEKRPALYELLGQQHKLGIGIKKDISKITGQYNRVDDFTGPPEMDLITDTGLGKTARWDKHKPAKDGSLVLPKQAKGKPVYGPKNEDISGLFDSGPRITDDVSGLFDAGPQTSKASDVRGLFTKGPRIKPIDAKGIAEKAAPPHVVKVEEAGNAAFYLRRGGNPKPNARLDDSIQITKKGALIKKDPMKAPVQKKNAAAMSRIREGRVQRHQTAEVAVDNYLYNKKTGQVSQAALHKETEALADISKQMGLEHVLPGDLTIEQAMTQATKLGKRFGVEMELVGQSFVKSGKKLKPVIDDTTFKTYLSSSRKPGDKMASSFIAIPKVYSNALKRNILHMGKDFGTALKYVEEMHNYLRPLNTIFRVGRTVGQIAPEQYLLMNASTAVGLNYLANGIKAASPKLNHAAAHMVWNNIFFGGDDFIKGLKGKSFAIGKNGKELPADEIFKALHEDGVLLANLDQKLNLGIDKRLKELHTVEEWKDLKHLKVANESYKKIAMEIAGTTAKGMVKTADKAYRKGANLTVKGLGKVAKYSGTTLATKVLDNYQRITIYLGALDDLTPLGRAKAAQVLREFGTIYKDVSPFTKRVLYDFGAYSPWYKQLYGGFVNGIMKHPGRVRNMLHGTKILGEITAEKKHKYTKEALREFAAARMMIPGMSDLNTEELAEWYKEVDPDSYTVMGLDFPHPASVTGQLDVEGAVASHVAPGLLFLASLFTGYDPTSRKKNKDIGPWFSKPINNEIGEIMKGKGSAAYAAWEKVSKSRGGWIIKQASKEVDRWSSWRQVHKMIGVMDKANPKLGLDMAAMAGAARQHGIKMRAIAWAYYYVKKAMGDDVRKPPPLPTGPSEYIQQPNLDAMMRRWEGYNEAKELQKAGRGATYRHNRE